MSKYVSITKLGRDEERAYNDLKFSVKCKNTGIIHSYDFNNELLYATKNIVALCCWAIYKNRHSHGHLTRVSLKEKLRYFLKFTELEGITSPMMLNHLTLKSFAWWLKEYSGLKYSVAGNVFRSLTCIFKKFVNHQSISNTFVLPKNMFPKSYSLTTNNEGYTAEEIKAILTLVVKELKATSSRLESAYTPKWIGKEPPIKDVAPFIPNRTTRSYWASKEYCHWFWENDLGCERLLLHEICRKPRGTSFAMGIAGYSTSRAEALEYFYQNIGAGEDYVPRYIGKPAPIKYQTPWASEDYIQWYWENEVGCKVLSDKELKLQHPKLYSGFRQHHPNWFKDFYEKNDIIKWVSINDLAPYYLMLLIRTGLNPSTINRLTVDCVEPDPLNPKRKQIKWDKFRSHKRGQTISVERGGDSWPIRIVQRVINITAAYRPESEKALWITNANRHKQPKAHSMAAFQRGIRKFAIDKNLRRPSDGEPIELKGCLFRPTLAWQEYLRTEDLNYLQSLLGHSRATTTSEYLRRLNDPIFKARRGLHQEAMLVGLATDTSRPFRFKTDIPETIKENVLTHCKDPFASPMRNQSIGSACNADTEVCLGCQNLVITPLDIKKYFCFINYYEGALAIGEIDEKDFSLATADKRYIWETYILPRYNRSIVERLRTEAIDSPIPEWSLAKDA